MLVDFEKKRLEMVRIIREGYGFKDERVLDVMQNVPRHEFVPRKYRMIAYEDCPVDIGYRQTMSQPFTVAKMTHLAIEFLISKFEFLNKSQLSILKSKKKLYETKPHNTKYFIHNTRVLEVGTGSGYQSAILSYFFDSVYTVEIVPELSRLAGNNLLRLGYKNVFTKAGSGEWGWKEHAPYDVIMITAGVKKVPKELFKQLKTDGVLVVPVGKGIDKTMIRYTKLKTQRSKLKITTQKSKLKKQRKEVIKIETFGTFHFVPFVGKDV